MKAQCVDRARRGQGQFPDPSKIRGGDRRDDHPFHASRPGLFEAAARLVQEIQVAVSVNEHTNTLHLRQP